MTSYFISDIHIKSLEDSSSRLLFFWLQNIWPTDKGDIYLLGDIFDIWVSDHSVFKKKYRPLIDELKKVKHQGFKVVYFEGNHDLHLKKFWQDELGFEVCFEMKYFEIDGSVIRLEHGDQINIEDHDYLKLRRTLRSPTMLFLGHWLPGHLWNWIGEKWSQKSRKNSYSYLESRKSDVIKMVRVHAQRSYYEKPFDAIITGHMHIVDDYEFPMNGKQIRSINLGTWLDGPKILKFKDGKFSWLETPIAKIEEGH